MRTDASARLQFSYLSVSYTIIPGLMRFSFKRFIYIIIGLLLFGSGEAFTIDARKSSKARLPGLQRKKEKVFLFKEEKHIHEVKKEEKEFTQPQVFKTPYKPQKDHKAVFPPCPAAGSGDERLSYACHQRCFAEMAA